jgi:hypothetical protein
MHEPGHTELSGGVISQLGFGFTVTVALHVPTQPLASVTVARYVFAPSVVGVTVKVVAVPGVVLV